MISTQDRDRAVIRLGELLASQLKVDRDIAVEVYDYVPASPKGLSPIVAIAPGGSNRNGKPGVFLIVVNLLVVYAIPEEAISESDAWRELSKLELATAEGLGILSRAEGYWNSLTWADFSEVQVRVLDGYGYLHEAIPLEVQIF